jgi:hypothetical protein
MTTIFAMPHVSARLQRIMLCLPGPKSGHLVLRLFVSVSKLSTVMANSPGAVTHRSRPKAGGQTDYRL